jgi:acyl carrier protein
VDAEIVKARIKEIIGDVAGLDATGIQDHDDFRDDLNLDSLLLIEVGVEVDMAFKLELPDERYQHISSVSAAAELVLERRRELKASEQAIPPPLA